MQKMAVVGSGWQFFFEASCRFARDFLRGFSSRNALDRCDSEVNLIVQREKPQQTPRLQKAGAGRWWCGAGFLTRLDASRTEPAG